MQIVTRLVLALMLAAPWPLLSGPSGAAAPSSSLPAFCELAPTTNTWQGKGVSADPGATDRWEEAANWSAGAPPAPFAGDSDVCIPTGGVPRIADGEETHLTTLDVAPGATLTVDPGGKVFLHGDQASDEDSVVRAGGRVDVVSGTLGGVAKLHVLGQLLLANDGGGAATLLTRDCAYDDTPGPSYPGEEPCTSPIPTPVSGPTGLAEVGPGGRLVVRGGGVNLGDQFRLVVRGLMTVGAGAYVAADHGTRLELRPAGGGATGRGVLRFAGDGGYLEGKVEADTGIAELSTLVNQGRIEKTGGVGRALVSAEYSQPRPGAVRVARGSVVLPVGTVRPARVAGGAAFGTGRCPEPDSPACVEGTDSSYPQSAQLQVPAGDSSGADVVVRRLARRSSTRDLGRPFEVHAAGLDATRRRLATIRLRFDASILDGKRAAQVQIFRRSGSGPYERVRSCARGRMPRGETACVDRRRRRGSTNVKNASGPPDVVMVVRALTTSRWVGR